MMLVPKESCAKAVRSSVASLSCTSATYQASAESPWPADFLVIVIRVVSEV